MKRFSGTDRSNYRRLIKQFLKRCSDLILRGCHFFLENAIHIFTTYRRDKTGLFRSFLSARQITIRHNRNKKGILVKMMIAIKRLSASSLRIIRLTLKRNVKEHIVEDTRAFNTFRSSSFFSPRNETARRI